MVVIINENRADNDSRWAFTGVYIERTGRILTRVLTRSI